VDRNNRCNLLHRRKLHGFGEIKSVFRLYLIKEMKRGRGEEVRRGRREEGEEMRML
jgi:hypothetical protein